MTGETFVDFAILAACLLVVAAFALLTLAIREQGRNQRAAHIAGQSPRQVEQLARMTADNPLGRPDIAEFQAIVDARAEALRVYREQKR